MIERPARALPSAPPFTRRALVTRPQLGGPPLALALALAFLTIACGRPPDGPSIRQDPTFQDPRLLEKAWRLPTAQAWRTGLVFQPNGAWCGPTTAASLLRSYGRLEVTPETVLEHTGESFWTVRFDGMTLDELAGVVRQKGRRVTVLRDLSLEQFQAHLERVNDPGRRYLINFTREPLFGKGGGHHSPVGGWLPEDRRVLVLDVNADYRPWLVAPEALFQAMDTVDSSSGKKRGLLMVE